MLRDSSINQHGLDEFYSECMEEKRNLLAFSLWQKGMQRAWTDEWLINFVRHFFDSKKCVFVLPCLHESYTTQCKLLNIYLHLSLFNNNRQLVVTNFGGHCSAPFSTPLPAEKLMAFLPALACAYLTYITFLSDLILILYESNWNPWILTNDCFKIELVNKPLRTEIKVLDFRKINNT